MKAMRKDKLHAAVKNVFGQCGWAVLDLSKLGDGVPDLLCIRRSLAILIEVKTAGAFRPGSKTLERQQAFRATWTACPVLVIETLEQAWKEAETLQLNGPAHFHGIGEEEEEART